MDFDALIRFTTNERLAMNECRRLMETELSLGVLRDIWRGFYGRCWFFVSKTPCGLIKKKTLKQAPSFLFLG